MWVVSKLRLLLVALIAAVLTTSCASGPGGEAESGVEPVRKPIVRRGANLAEDIDRFHSGGYLLLRCETSEPPSFGEGAGKAYKRARKIGAHLVVAYEALSADGIAEVRSPLFMSEPPFSPERFAETIAGAEPGPFVVFYWARPNTPLPLGAFFYAELPEASRAELDGRAAVQVQALVRGSNASLGYLIDEDLITHFEGEAVSRDPKELIAKLRAKRGERVTFTVLRDGDAQDKVVSLYP